MGKTNEGVIELEINSQEFCFESFALSGRKKRNRWQFRSRMFWPSFWVACSSYQLWRNLRKHLIWKASVFFWRWPVQLCRIMRIIKLAKIWFGMEAVCCTRVFVCCFLPLLLLSNHIKSWADQDIWNTSFIPPICPCVQCWRSSNSCCWNSGGDDWESCCK